MLLRSAIYGAIAAFIASIVLIANRMTLGWFSEKDTFEAMICLGAYLSASLLFSAKHKPTLWHSLTAPMVIFFVFWVAGEIEAFLLNRISQLENIYRVWPLLVFGAAFLVPLGMLMSVFGKYVGVSLIPAFKVRIHRQSHLTDTRTGDKH